MSRTNRSVSGRRLLALVAIAGVAPLTVAACGSTNSGMGAAAGGEDIRKLTLLVGTEPGGGFDLTARAFAKAAKDAGLANNIQVQNLPGAGSTIALARLANQEGSAQSMQLMGLGLVGGIVANKSKTTLANTTPVARLTQEPDIIVVSKDSEYRTIADLVSSWKADPGKHPVGFGLEPGRARSHRHDADRAGRRHRAQARSTTSRSRAAASSTPRCSATRSASA